MTNKMTGLRLVLPAALLLMVGACGGGGGGGAIALSDLGEEVGESLCSDAVECGLYPTKQACLDSFGFDVSQLEADVAAGLVEYDGAKARECLNESTVSICNIGDGSDEQEPAACDETFTGSIALGGSCFSDEVCAGDAECEGFRTDDGCSAGTCIAAVPDPTLGQSCANESCADDLRCNEQQICEARGAAGATCTGFIDCASGLICEFGQDQTPGTCVALAATGGSCNPEIGGGFFSACLSTNDFCDAADSICKNRLTPGTSCASETLGNACVRYAECIEGSCVANLLLGEACVIDGAGPNCIGGLECDGAVCAADAPDPVCTL